MRAVHFAALAVLELGLLAGAFGAGYHMEKRRLDVCVTTSDQLGKQNAAMLAREHVMESVVAVVHGSYGYAFERLIAAQFAARSGGLRFERDFEAVSQALLQQAPDVQQRLLALGDKLLGMPYKAFAEPQQQKAPTAAPAGTAPTPAR